MISPNGLQLNNGVAIFVVPSDPNALAISPRLASAPSLIGVNESLATASLGSLAIDYGAAKLWIKTAQPTQSAPTGTWLAGTFS